MARVLIIDDNRAVLRTVRRTLERAGHTVEAAANGDEGLRILRERPADLVITDVFMPRKDGIETIREIRGEFPGTPILAISGGGSLRELAPLEDAKVFGANLTLAKPFQVEELRGAVARLLGG